MDPQPPSADARTIGFWKNHPDLIGEIIAEKKIGPAPGLTVPEIVAILENASAKDAKNALSAQRMAAIFAVVLILWTTEKCWAFPSPVI